MTNTATNPASVPTSTMDLDVLAIYRALEAYTGSFPYLVKMKNKANVTIRRWGKISEDDFTFKQWWGMAKCLKVGHPSLVANTVNPRQLSREDLAIVNDITQYQGKYAFLLDLQSKVKAGKSLTAKQLAAAKKCLGKSVKVSGQFSPTDPRAESLILRTPVPVVLKRWVAQQIKKKHGLEFTPITVTVNQFYGQTDKAVRIKIKLTSGDVTNCRCCGASLKDEKSKATGVGPVCARKLGIEYIRDKNDIARWKQDLQVKVDQLGSWEEWIPKSQIKEGQAELRAALKDARASKQPSKP